MAEAKRDHDEFQREKELLSPLSVFFQPGMHAPLALSRLILTKSTVMGSEPGVKSFARLGKPLALGLAFLFLMLAITFKSFLDPLAIMISLPMGVIGAAWAMKSAGKHGCMPSFMGFILLMGIVVNNGILLVDFAKVRMNHGQNLREAILDAVRHRTRPKNMF